MSWHSTHPRCVSAPCRLLPVSITFFMLTSLVPSAIAIGWLWHSKHRFLGSSFSSEAWSPACAKWQLVQPRLVVTAACCVVALPIVCAMSWWHSVHSFAGAESNSPGSSVACGSWHTRQSPSTGAWTTDLVSISIPTRTWHFRHRSRPSWFSSLGNFDVCGWWHAPHAPIDAGPCTRSCAPVMSLWHAAHESA